MSAVSCQQKSFGHPCFNKEAHHKVGRIHLPVAPRCNIKCKYCFRRHDCANESRPGVTSRIISPAQAIELVRNTIARDPRIKVVGIAGPGDPLANEATLETLRLLDQEFPQLSKCLSTNGLRLPDTLDQLLEVGLDYLTVTVNTINPQTGRQIYSWIKYQGTIIQGEDAVTVLSYNQMQGIIKAVKYGLKVKVNSVLIPGINDEDMPQLAGVLKKLGVELMNVMPLIPQAEFASFSPVSLSLLNQVRDECERIIPQSRHCKQCRADAIGIPGETNLFSRASCQTPVNSISVPVAN